MMLPKLYDIAADIEQALMDEEFDPARLEALVENMTDKAAAILSVSTNINGFVDLCKAEEKRIAQARKFAENRDARLKEYLKDCMEVAGMYELPIGTRVIRIQKNPPSVVIDNELAIPGKYVEIVQTNRIDKIAIKDALKRGETVEGAHLEAGTRLAVK